MKYSVEEVMEYVIEEDVKFIRLAFCDVFGTMKNKSIMPGELMRAFKYGIAIDASAIRGFGGEVYSDLLLHPDPDTLALLPWRPEHGRVVQMICTVTYPDGTVFENDARTLLKKAVERAESEGFHFSFGSEMEFYLFDLDENGAPTKKPHDWAGYMDIAPLDKGENVRRDICLTLERMGIMPESSHHEEGPGQNEIDFRYSDPLTAADNAITFARVVRSIAFRNGLYADFSPKPITDQPGNGMHINISVKSDNGEDMTDHMIAGILNRVPAMTIFLNPTEDSYKRFGANKAPRYVTWSSENRSQLIRIPAAYDEFKRVELRSPDPGANPYIAYTLLIYACLHGLEREELLPEPTNANLFKADKAAVRGLTLLPESRTEAAKIAQESEFIKTHLPQSLIDTYCE